MAGGVANRSLETLKPSVAQVDISGSTLVRRRLESVTSREIRLIPRQGRANETISQQISVSEEPSPVTMNAPQANNLRGPGVHAMVG